MATILDLSLKNVLKIEQVTDEKGKEDSRITLIGYDESAIKEDELRIIKFLKNAITSNGTNGNSITLKELKKYINKNSESIVLLKSCIDESVKHNLLNQNILSKEAIQQRKSMKYKKIGVSLDDVLGEEKRKPVNRMNLLGWMGFRKEFLKMANLKLHNRTVAHYK